MTPLTVNTIDELVRRGIPAPRSITGQVRNHRSLPTTVEAVQRVQNQIGTGRAVPGGRCRGATFRLRRTHPKSPFIVSKDSLRIGIANQQRSFAPRDVGRRRQPVPVSAKARCIDGSHEEAHMVDLAAAIFDNHHAGLFEPLTRG